MAVSQKQIAEKLGVSVALVSRVLSGRAREIGIVAETIDRVLETAKHMGYVPSAAALALKGKATRTVGVVVYDFRDPFFGAIIEQLQIQTREHSYSLVLTGFLRRSPDEQDLQPLHKHAIDGLIIIGSDLSASWLESFRHVPVARIGHGSPEEASVRVTIDEDEAARLLVNHLVESGRKQLAHISADHPAHRMRQEAVLKAAAARGVACTIGTSPKQDPFEAGLQVVSEWVETDVDALICSTDLVAMGALYALSGTHGELPRDMAITGFDDIDAARHSIPPLTTIRQPIAAMVNTAVESVVQKAAPSTICLSPELIVRTSA